MSSEDVTARGKGKNERKRSINQLNQSSNDDTPPTKIQQTIQSSNGEVAPVFSDDGIEVFDLDELDNEIRCQPSTKQRNTVSMKIDVLEVMGKDGPRTYLICVRGNGSAQSKLQLGGNLAEGNRVLKGRTFIFEKMEKGEHLNEPFFKSVIKYFGKDALEFPSWLAIRTQSSLPGKLSTNPTVMDDILDILRTLKTDDGNDITIVERHHLMNREHVETFASFVNFLSGKRNAYNADASNPATPNKTILA